MHVETSISISRRAYLEFDATGSCCPLPINGGQVLESRAIATLLRYRFSKEQWNQVIDSSVETQKSPLTLPSIQ